MAERHVVSALRRKYAELAGRMRFEPDTDKRELRAAIRQVGAVLLMFAPGEDLAAIKAVRPYPAMREKWLRDALGIMRAEQRPFSARELAYRVMEARGVAPTYETMKSIECGLYAQLARLEGRGLERLDGAPKRWTVQRSALL